KAKIRESFIENGGLPINTKDPMPVDLEVMTSRELIHVAQNMRIFLVRSRKDDIVSRCLNVVSNVAYLGSRFGGARVDQTLQGALQSDHVLRQSFVEVFIGRTANIHPVLT